MPNPIYTLLWTLLRILIDLDNAVVWMVSTHPLISSPCSNPLVTVPRALMTIRITLTFMFHIIIIHSLELFTSALADGFSLESK